jgi:O-antigen biosynthesis protein
MTLVAAQPRTSVTALARPRSAGKFIYVGDEKLWIRGVTYGTFRPTSRGERFDASAVQRDFALMREAGFNAVRTYESPPRWLLDEAQRQGLRVMAGLAWEQHVAFLDDRRRAAAIERRVRDEARELAGHPALLCLAVGNEIPGPIVRWHGARRVEAFLGRLADAVREHDPEALVTYVNYPTTEYLDLSFADLLTFNVYLERRDRYEAYLARLQNLAGDRPLLMAEIGLDSRRHGEATQAGSLDWQIRSSFAAGCSGAFVFAWTDEWHRGGHDIEDWDFGLVRRDRSPKPALAAASQAFADAPFPRDTPWPRVSVVVCSYNGGATIRDCLEGLRRLDYPDFEIIVVNDGSTDATGAIAAEYDVRLISTENRGLSSARNTGLEAATGEIVAYTDDDARPDAHWLKYIAHAFMTTDHAAMGGPNIPPADDPPLAEVVANAPGGPLHVLLDDQLAEHVPGCNIAFRRQALLAIGGFDPVYRAAGDDVDACWRIQQQGWTIGFHAGAMVWHHRRASIRMYWKQQQGYGKAEALLERKWPERYNALGHLAWMGRIYGRGLTFALGRRGGLIYGGSGGNAPFQRMYQPSIGLLAALPLMPEWYLLLGSLAGLGLIGLLWPPLLVAWLALLAGLGIVGAQAVRSAAAADFRRPGRGRAEVLRLRAVTALLHVLQPLARLRGRQAHGLTPWRGRGPRRLALPLPRTETRWSEAWRGPDEWLADLCARLRGMGAVVLMGGSFDRWDVEVRGGLLGGARLRFGVEEHGAGTQMLRYRVWPRPSRVSVALGIALAITAALAALDGALLAGAIVALGAAVVAGLTVHDVTSALGRVEAGLPRP